MTHLLEATLAIPIFINSGARVKPSSGQGKKKTRKEIKTTLHSPFAFPEPPNCSPFHHHCRVPALATEAAFAPAETDTWETVRWMVQHEN